MQVSMKWLSDYLKIDCTADELAEKFTMAGIPVENVIHAGEGLEKVVTGKIVELTAHPDSDHLLVCQMDVGGENLLQIVTGAPNVKQGQVVPVALVGAHLPNGQKISKGKLRGVASNGMLCSADELKLELEKLPEEQKTGIYILPNDTPIGQPAAKVLGLDDDILEFELTANRGDCFSVYGLIREAAVLLNATPKFPVIEVKEDAGQNARDLIEIKIDAPDLCQRFSSRVLTDVKLFPSPEWMQKRLEGAGIRAINNVVDVTNFVMVELGQPMHAYDYDEVKGHVLNARRAVAGEQLHTLDDSNRLAKGDELVIADAEKAAGLAGVMGGLETEITPKTKTVVLEAAAFNSASIRRTSRAVGLHSEASGRFERGTNANITVTALNRAAQLLQEMGACKVCAGIVDVYPSPKSEVKVSFTTKQINDRLGTNLDDEKIFDILKSLGFKLETTSYQPQATSYEVTVPDWRNDVKLMDDLSEEVARIYGYDNIPATLPKGFQQGRQSEFQNFVDKIKFTLANLGMDEITSFAFTNAEMFDTLQVPANSELRRAVPIMNPLTDEAPLLRTTLLSSVLENAARNISHKNDDVRLFEVAPVFFPKSLPVTELPDEVQKLVGVLIGRREPKGWSQNSAEVDFYDAKGIVEELFEELKIERYSVEAGEHYAMHPGKTAIFKKGREILATVGEIHPAVTESLGVNKKIFAFECDVATLLKCAAKKFNFEVLPKYPAITRDLAILVNHDVAAGEVEKVIAKSAGQFFKGVTLFDVYVGDRISADKKSLAFTIKFQSNERTLKDEEADAAFKNILSTLEKTFAAELRS
ncbi:MAG: phenylalanine--tRNA ligase subunit beta [Selenomonadaceae bacterium]|nr:phenylalanine--tRNA ligase subunit beta [Selenomonadaceae bacterium]